MAVILIDDAFASESQTFVDFTARLTAPVAQRVTVNYTIAGLSAGGADLVGGNGSFAFDPGQTTQTFRVQLLPDAAVESIEAYRVAFSGAVNAQLGTTQALGFIVDNDAPTGTPVARLLGGATVDETDGAARFVVALDRPSTTPVTIAWSTADGSAQAGGDYTASAGVLTFAPGVVAQTLSVPILDDAQPEPDESFAIALSAPVGAVLGDARADAIIGRSDATASTGPSVSVADAIADENDGWESFTVQLSAPSTQVVSVNYTVRGLSAGGADVTAVSGTLAFDPGQTTRAVRVPVAADVAVESTEVFQVGLSGPVNAVLGNSAAWGQVFDRDGAAGAPTISVSDVVVDERDAFARFVVSTDRPSTSPFTVAYATAAGTASAGADFAPVSGTLTFDAGQRAQTVLVPIVDDSAREPDELFSLALSAPSLGSLGHASGSALIGRNDAPAATLPIVSTASVNVDESMVFADFVVQLSTPSVQRVSVGWVASGATAGGADLSGESGTVVFEPGETTRVVQVPLFTDTAIEPAEVFRFTLASPVNAQLGSGGVIGAIQDNDAVAGAPRISIGDTVAFEGDVARLPVTLDRPATSPLTVSYATFDASAVGGADYLPASGTLVFLPGETARTVLVTVLDNAAAESNEVFDVRLAAPSQGLLADAGGTVLIPRNDMAAVNVPSASVQPVTAGENEPYADFIVQLDRPGTQRASVNFTVSGVTAGGADVVAQSGTLVFDAGQTAAVARVPIISDALAEPAETFRLSLSGPVNLVIASDSTSVLGTIVDDDSGPSGSQLRFGVPEADHAEGTGTGNAFTFEVERVGDTSQGAFVNWAVTSASADPADFGATAFASGQLQFASGEASKLIVLQAAGDAALERHEDFALTLSGAFGTTLDSATQAGRLRNDDPVPRDHVPTYGSDATFLFDPVYYLWKYPELVPTVSLAAAATDYLTAGAAAGRSPNSWFDPIYYANRWPDLTPLHLDDATLFAHFNLYGVWEGRSPGPKFQQIDGDRYLAENPDVAAYVDANLGSFLGSRSNGAIAHFIIYGNAEQRLAFDTNAQVITLDYLLS